MGLFVNILHDGSSQSGVAHCYLAASPLTCYLDFQDSIWANSSGRRACSAPNPQILGLQGFGCEFSLVFYGGIQGCQGTRLLALVFNQCRRAHALFIPDWPYLGLGL